VASNSFAVRGSSHVYGPRQVWLGMAGSSSYLDIVCLSGYFLRYIHCRICNNGQREY
jgi:hypothetical protein